MPAKTLDEITDEVWAAITKSGNPENLTYENVRATLVVVFDKYNPERFINPSSDTTAPTD